MAPHDIPFTIAGIMLLSLIIVAAVDWAASLKR